MAIAMKTARRADRPVPARRHRIRWLDWLSRRWRRLRRRSPSLSDMLRLPTFDEHAFPSAIAGEPAWYVLLVPTFHEGQDVADTLTKMLARQKADFTVVIAYYEDDPSADSILRAARDDQRIVPLQIHLGGDMESALCQQLSSLEQRRGRTASDALIVPLPGLLLQVR